MLASVGGAYNAIYIQGEALGFDHVLRPRRRRNADCDRRGSRYSGRCPDASGRAEQSARPRAGLPCRPDEGRQGNAGGAAGWCQYYLRFMAEDKPGVLGRIASVLGHHKISMASVIQQERAPR